MSVFNTSYYDNMTSTTTNTFRGDAASVARRIYIDKTIQVQSLQFYLGISANTMSAIIYTDAGALVAKSPARSVPAGTITTFTFSSPANLAAGWYRIGYSGEGGITPQAEGAGTVTRKVGTVTFTANTGTFADGGDVFPTSNPGYGNDMQFAINFTDNTAPTAPGLNGPGNGTITNNTNQTFSWTHNDPDGNPQYAWQLQVSTDSTFGTVNGIDTGKVINGAQSWANNVALGDAQWFWRMRTWDPSDAVSPWSWVPWFGIERTPPSASSVSGTQYTTTASGGTFRVWAYGVTDNWSGVSIVRFPTGFNAANFVWFDGVKNGSTNDWYCDIPINSVSGGGPEGRYQTDIYAYDSAGNNKFVGGVSSYVDRTLPAIGGITGATYTRTATQRMTITGASDANGIKNVDAYILNKAGSTWSGPYVAINGGNGSWYYDFNASYEGEGYHTVRFWVYDNANNGNYIDSSITYDTVIPAAPTYSFGTPTSKTIPITGISAFNDPAPSSGFANRYVCVNQGGTRIQTNDVGNVSSYTVTGLSPGVEYTIYIVDYDKSGNGHDGTTTYITTKAAPTATIQNISSNGYVVNQRPTLQVSGTEYNGSSNEYRIIISKNSNMSAPLADTWAGTSHTTETGYSGWTTHGAIASGAVNVYTPQVDLGTGIVYVQVQAYSNSDGGFSGALSTFSFTINAPAWATTVSDTDMAISKRTIDDVRIKINAVRQARGMGTKTWTDPTINDWNNVLPTKVRGAHLTELRTAIQEIWTALGKGTVPWTDITIDTTVARKGKHWNDLRTNLIAC